MRIRRNRNEINKIQVNGGEIVVLPSIKRTRSAPNLLSITTSDDDSDSTISSLNGGEIVVQSPIRRTRSAPNLLSIIISDDDSDSTISSLDLNTLPSSITGGSSSLGFQSLHDIFEF